MNHYLLIEKESEEVEGGRIVKYILSSSNNIPTNEDSRYLFVRVNGDKLPDGQLVGFYRVDMKELKKKKLKIIRIKEVQPMLDLT